MADDDQKKYIPKQPEPGIREIVLPSGRYARMRPLTWMDLVTSYDSNPFAMLAKLALSTVEIDGENMTADDISGMGMEDASPIMAMIGDAMLQAQKFQGGVK